MVRPSKLQPRGAPGSFFSSGIELSEQFCHTATDNELSRVSSCSNLAVAGTHIHARSLCQVRSQKFSGGVAGTGTHDCDERHLAGAKVRLEAVRRHVVPDDHLVQPLPVARDLQS